MQILVDGMGVTYLQMDYEATQEQEAPLVAMVHAIDKDVLPHAYEVSLTCVNLPGYIIGTLFSCPASDLHRGDGDCLR